MLRLFFLRSSEKTTRSALFIFFSLLLLSLAFFVFAEENTAAKNIFIDSDQDGLSNEEEKLYGTDPTVKDTDGDGYSDGVEVESGYDPLKAAPGDKLLPPVSPISASLSGSASENLTEKVSSEIVSMLKNSDKNTEEISLEKLDESVQNILSSNPEDIVLPEVDIKEIKIKKLKKGLKGSARDEQIKQDALEYLTIVAYLMANNSPRSFETEDDLSGMLTDLSGNSIASLLSGNLEYVEQLATRGEKILKELKTIEVPEQMVDLHVKALKMALYMIQLKEELILTDPNDPLGKIEKISKIQGLFGAAASFGQEVQSKLSVYGIDNIPIDL